MSGRRRRPSRTRDDRPASDLTPEELVERRRRNAARMKEASERARERIERAEAAAGLPPDWLPDGDEDDVAQREAGDRAWPGAAVSVEVALAMLEAFGETRH